MSFKNAPALASLVPLDGFGLLAVSGPDAAAFLQAQTMNDVRDLTPGRWQWNGWLNPKGRVVALFALLRTGEQAFLVVLPDFPPAELQALWQRYVFRSKVALSVPSGWCCAAGSGALAEGAPDHADGDDAGWRLSWDGAGGERSLWILPHEHPALANPDPRAARAWRDQDLRRGMPRLDAASRERWTPHMLGLERLPAFSVRKGCYPGQEIVARTHFLGQAKRTLFGLEGDIPRESAQITDDAGRAVGEVVAVASAADFCLAVLPGDLGGDGLTLGSVPVRIVSLPGSGRTRM